MLEYTLEELLGTPISRIHPGEQQQLQEFVGEVMRRGHGSTATLTCRTRTGRRLPAEISLWAFGADARVLLLALACDRSEHRARPRE